jgi:hypothetical protein
MKVAKVLQKIINYDNIKNLCEDMDNDGPIEIFIIEPQICNIDLIENIITLNRWDCYNGIYSVFPSDSLSRQKMMQYNYVIYNNKTKQFMNKYFFTKEFYCHKLINA